MRNAGMAQNGSALLEENAPILEEGAKALEQGVLSQSQAPGLSEGASKVAQGLDSAPVASGWIDTAQSGGLGSYFEILAILFLGLAVLCFLLWLTKKLGRGTFLTRAQDLSIESRLNLGQKKWIIVARIHGKRLALGLTDENISLLTELASVKEFESSLPVDDKKPLNMEIFKKNAKTIFDKGKSFADIAEKEFSKGMGDELNKAEEQKKHEADS